MKRTIRFTSSLLLAGALTVPIAVQARDDHDRDDRNRVYDRAHRDYHQWTPDEDRYYRQWYGDKYHGRNYRDYHKVNRKDQDAYWNWRHAHEDHDHDHDRH